MTRGLAAIGLAAGLAACTQSHLEYQPDGGFTLDYARSMTSAAVSVQAPDGARLDYSSDPQSAGFDRLAGLLEQVLALIARGAVLADSQVPASRTTLPMQLQAPPLPLVPGGATWQRF